MNCDTTLEQILASLQDNDNSLMLLDGGTGRELFRRGVPDDRKMWSARAVVDTRYHDTLIDVHQSFLKAGAMCITTNSYTMIPSAGFTRDEIARHCATAGRLARQAVTSSSSSSSSSTPPAFVLGSLGPLVESYRPDLIMKHEQGVPYYVDMINAMAPTVDAFVAETMSCVEEAMQPVQALAQSSKNKSLWIAFTLNSKGKLRSEQPLVEAIPRILDYAFQQRVQGKVFLILSRAEETMVELILILMRLPLFISPPYFQFLSFFLIAVNLKPLPLLYKRFETMRLLLQHWLVATFSWVLAPIG